MESKCPVAQATEYTVRWDEYSKDFKILLKKLRKYRFTGIIPILRGGLVLATHLSYLLQIPIEMPRELKRTGYYLIVDDLVDSGVTMKRYCNILMHEKLRFKTATLYRKDITEFEPDFYVKTINKWINFPWEML